MGSTGLDSGVGGAGTGSRLNDPTLSSGQPHRDIASSSTNPDTSARTGLQSSSNPNTTTGTGLTQVENKEIPNTSRSTDSPNTRSANTMSDTNDTTSKHDAAPTTHKAPTNDTPDDGTGEAKQAKGKDPSTLEIGDKKLTGTGQPGSHSALFGLTPDGHKEKDANYDAGGNVEPAEEGQEAKAATGDGDEKSAGAADTKGASGDTGSRDASGAGVAKQFDHPDVNAARADDHGPTTTDTSGKAGSGTGLPSQGSKFK